MVVHHECSVFEFDGIGVCALPNSKNKLCLSLIHGRIESSRVHSKWIEILFLSDVTISSYESF